MDEPVYGFNRNDTIELLNLIGNEDGTFSEIATPGGGGSSIKHAFAPSGGIPAATNGTSVLIPGFAICLVAENVGGSYQITTETVIVENPVGTVVGSGGKAMTIGLNSSGNWTVLVEDCSVSSSSGPVATDQDPLGGATYLGITL